MDQAFEWWSSLSINEQNKYVSEHPYFKHFGPLYVMEHKTAITQIYEYFILIKRW